MMIKLLPADDAVFVNLQSGIAPAGLRIADGGLEPPGVLAMLGRMAARVDAVCAPSAWMMVAGEEVVGLISLKTPPDAQGVAEIGYGVAATRRGQGFATAAMAALIHLAREDRNLAGFTAETSAKNPASQRVLEKNGFCSTGTRMDAEDGELRTWLRSIQPSNAS
jgi:predicted acetyltransferase